MIWICYFPLDIDFPRWQNFKNRQNSQLSSSAEKNQNLKRAISYPWKNKAGWLCCLPTAFKCSCSAEPDTILFFSAYPLWDRTWCCHGELIWTEESGRYSQAFTCNLKLFPTRNQCQQGPYSTFPLQGSAFSSWLFYILLELKTPAISQEKSCVWVLESSVQSIWKMSVTKWCKAFSSQE